MENEEIKILKEEIESLRWQMASLKATQDEDRRQAIKLSKEIYQSTYQFIADIHDYLWPVVHKLFPKYAESQKQIDAFMKSRLPVDEKNKDSDRR